MHFIIVMLVKASSMLYVHLLAALGTMQGNVLIILLKQAEDQVL
jgi:uncharacterized membrane protein